MERDAPRLNGRDPHAAVNHAALQGFLAGVVGRSRRMAGARAADGRLDLVTGAWSYLGGHVAAELLDRGRRVRTLTSRPVPAPDPFAGAVEARAWSWDDPVRLRKALKGVDTLYNTYWTRHTRPPVGHRGPWTSHDAAVKRSALLFAAAAEAGVRRVVHVGITLPPDPRSAAELSAAGPEAARASIRAGRAASELPYFRGKQLVELSLQGFGASHGLSHAVLRPSCFFGGDDILVNNIAYGVRRFPLFPLPRPLGYRIRPIHVRDMARAMCDCGAGTDNVVRDACGPEQYAFDDLVARMAGWLGVRPCRPLPLPPAVCRGLYGTAGLVLRDTVLSRDELVGLSSDLLGSDEDPLGATRLSEWVRDHRHALGLRFRPEPPR